MHPLRFLQAMQALAVTAPFSGIGGRLPSSKPLAWTIHDDRGRLVWCGTMNGAINAWRRRVSAGGTGTLRDYADRSIANA